MTWINLAYCIQVTFNEITDKAKTTFFVILVKSLVRIHGSPVHFCRL